jgi:hypothetical protein
LAGSLTSVGLRWLWRRYRFGLCGRSNRRPNRLRLCFLWLSLLSAAFVSAAHDLLLTAVVRRRSSFPAKDSSTKGLMSKGSEAKLSYLGHVLMENRNGLLVQTFLTEANGRAERDAAMLMAESIPGGKRVTLGGDKNYDTQEFVRELRGMNITPHVAQNDTNRSSAIDQRTARHPGYEVSQQKRKRVEQSFGWMKMVGMLRKVKLRGMDKVGWLFTFTGAAYNLCRLRNLMA